MLGGGQFANLTAQCLGGRCWLGDSSGLGPPHLPRSNRHYSLKLKEAQTAFAESKMNEVSLLNRKMLASLTRVAVCSSDFFGSKERLITAALTQIRLRLPREGVGSSGH